MSVTRIGTCGICGGAVSVPAVWFGIIPPDAHCERCGAVPKNQYGPVLPMEQARQYTIEAATRKAVMEDEILKATDEIMRSVRIESDWLSRDRAAIVKILKQLVEGVRERAPNIARDEICPHFFTDRVDLTGDGNNFEVMHCCRVSGKLSPVA
jgi:hypothetical protein